jgi:hypothetical protein
VDTRSLYNFLHYVNVREIRPEVADEYRVAMLQERTTSNTDTKRRHMHHQFFSFGTKGHFDAGRLLDENLAVAPRMIRMLVRDCHF